MDDRRIVLELSDEMRDDLARVAEVLEISDLNEAALIGLADWIARRKAEIDDRDPARKYFINEALDELLSRKK